MTALRFPEPILWPDDLQAIVDAEITARRDLIEDLMAEAVMLQDYDRLDHLYTRHEDDKTPSVASRLEPFR